MYSASGLSLSTSGRTKLFSARICAVGAPVSPPPLGSARQHLAAPLLGRLLLPLLRLPLPSAAPRRPAAAAIPRRPAPPSALCCRERAPGAGGGGGRARARAESSKVRTEREDRRS